VGSWQKPFGSMNAKELVVKAQAENARATLERMDLKCKSAKTQRQYYGATPLCQRLLRRDSVTVVNEKILWLTHC
jgi:hypothetical protein